MDDAQPRAAEWNKSSFSNASNDCVEWALDRSTVRLRHSKAREGHELVFTAPEWAAFLAAVKAGEADL